MPARNRVAQLRATGMTWQQIADTAGLARDTVRDLQDRQRTEAAKAAAILAVDPPTGTLPPPDPHVPQTRIQRMMSLNHADDQRHRKSVRLDTIETRVGAWRDRAECRTEPPRVFFPDRGEPVNAAIAICDRCQVRTQCLNYAIAAGENYGIWGGLTRRQRSNLHRTRNAS